MRRRLAGNSYRSARISIAALLSVLALPIAGQAQLVFLNTATAVIAQAPDPGDLLYKYVDHTNTPIYTVDDINMSWAPISLGRNETTELPPLPASIGRVYSNIGGPFIHAEWGSYAGGDDYDSIETTPTIANMDGFGFIGGVMIAGDVIFFDHYDQNTIGGPGNLIDSWGVQLPYGGIWGWTLTGLGLTNPIPDKGWVFATGMPVTGPGFVTWYMSDHEPNIGSEDPTQGGAGPGWRHNFELYNVIDPGNDSCADARPTGAMPSATHGYNFLATTDRTGCLPFLPQGNVWFTVIGDGTTITADLCNTSGIGLGIWISDAAMSLHCNGCDTPVCIDFDENPCGSYSTVRSMSWCSAPGEVYTIGVGANFDGFRDFGEFNLEISSDGQPCSTADPCIACGDGVVEGDEECEDGNSIDGDGCTAGCLREPECGNGMREGPTDCALCTEDCDDGNAIDGDGCSSTCRFEGDVPAVSDWGMAALGILLLIGLAVKHWRPATDRA